MTGDDLIELWAEEARQSAGDALVVADVATITQRGT